METFADVFRAHARADRALFNNLHRCGKCTGAQQQCNIRGFLRRIHAGDLHPATADFFANNGRRDDLGFAFFNQQNRHALTNVFTRSVFKYPRAFAVEVDVNRGLTGLAVESG